MTMTANSFWHGRPESQLANLVSSEAEAQAIISQVREETYAALDGDKSAPGYDDAWDAEYERPVDRMDRLLNIVGSQWLRGRRDVAGRINWIVRASLAAQDRRWGRSAT